MKKFIKITTRKDDAILRSWINIEDVAFLTQNSITEEGVNEGFCVFTDGKTANLIAFNETLESLNK